MAKVAWSAGVVCKRSHIHPILRPQQPEMLPWARRRRLPLISQAQAQAEIAAATAAQPVDAPSPSLSPSIDHPCRLAAAISDFRAGNDLAPAAFPEQFAPAAAGRLAH
jgi:hypothetical protein